MCHGHREVPSLWLDIILCPCIRRILIAVCAQVAFFWVMCFATWIHTNVSVEPAFPILGCLTTISEYRDYIVSNDGISD
jgi:hypothetical protein